MIFSSLRALKGLAKRPETSQKLSDFRRWKALFISLAFGEASGAEARRRFGDCFRASGMGMGLPCSSTGSSVVSDLTLLLRCTSNMRPLLLDRLLRLVCVLLRRRCVAAESGVSFSEAARSSSASRQAVHCVKLLPAAQQARQAWKAISWPSRSRCLPQLTQLTS